MFRELVKTGKGELRVYRKRRRFGRVERLMRNKTVNIMTRG
jgi:hypothetical protein